MKQVGELQLPSDESAAPGKADKIPAGYEYPLGPGGRELSKCQSGPYGSEDMQPQQPGLLQHCPRHGNIAGPATWRERHGP